MPIAKGQTTEDCCLQTYSDHSKVSANATVNKQWLPVLNHMKEQAHSEFLVNLKDDGFLREVYFIYTGR